MEIFERIKEIRKESGLSQAAFGNRIGVSRDVINNIENNRLSKPEQKEPIFKLICKEFRINEHWLRTGEGQKELLIERDEYTQAVNDIDVKDPKARQAILDYWKLSEEDKETFWAFVERFIKK